MIATWMIYGAIIAGVLGLSALALEQGLRLIHKPARFVWLLPLVGSVAIPVLGFTLPDTTGEQQTIGYSTPSIATLPVPARAVPEAVRWSVHALRILDGPLTVAWILGVLTVAAFLVWTAREMRRERSWWQPGRVNGVDVLYSTSSGPAVIGCFPGTIVLPRWTRHLHRDWQRLMVMHEVEHLRAGDTGLILAALVMAAMVPWNPVVWWQVKRLRHAIELDCDNRVIRRGANRRTYGELLIELTQRRRLGALPVAALSATQPLLARRIQHMIASTQPANWRRALAAATVAAVIVVIGCELPTPPNRDSDTALVTAREDGPAALQSLLADARARLKESEGALAAFDAANGDPTTVELTQRRERLTETVLTARAHLEAVQRSSGLVKIREQRDPTTATFTETTYRTQSLVNGDVPQPLVFIDGEEVSVGEDRLSNATDVRRLHVKEAISLRDLDPGQIERIEVVKGAAAERLYGEAARWGVIHITTKAAAANEQASRR